MYGDAVAMKCVDSKTVDTPAVALGWHASLLLPAGRRLVSRSEVSAVAIPDTPPGVSLPPELPDWSGRRVSAEVPQPERGRAAARQDLHAEPSSATEAGSGAVTERRGSGSRTRQ